MIRLKNSHPKWKNIHIHGGALGFMTSYEESYFQDLPFMVDM